MQVWIKRLEKHEGFSSKIYKCPAGYNTIGIGRNLDTNPLTDEEKEVCGDISKGITKDQAYYLLGNDISRCVKELEIAFPFLYNLDVERRYALIDLCFNMGIHSLLKFKKMIAKLEILDFSGAAEELLDSKYARQVPKRALRIAHLISTGVWYE